MRKNIITLVTFLGGILYASLGIPILFFAINYRQIQLNEYFALYLVIIFGLYNFGIYITATLFQFYSKRKIDIVPSALAFGSLIGSALGYLVIILLNPPDFVNRLGIVLLFPLVGIRAACAFEVNKSISLTRPLLKISTVVAVNLILLFVVCRSDFPGVNAPIEIRQKWAYEEFRAYSDVVNSIGLCNPITDKVGKIKFIAPTKGRNIHTTEGGSGDNAELTLEVVGEKGTGIVHLRGMFVPSPEFFEYQGKKTRVSCVK